MKNVLLLEHYYSPDELRQRVAEWVDNYNNQRYQESLDNLTPADMYWGHYDTIKSWPNGKKSSRTGAPELSMAQRRKNYIYQKLQSAKSFISICTLSVDDIQFKPYTVNEIKLA